VKLVYFAWVRQKAGTNEENFELPPGVKTARDLAALLRSRGGGYEEAFADLKRLRVAINQEHASWDASIGPDDEVAFFPPVTGG
jgi:molybdopterin synthase sulfur carrier subunit